MSELLPTTPDGAFDDAEHTRIVEPEPTTEQRLARWGVHAGRWRAVEIAEAVWGPGVRSHLAGCTPEGAFRGLLHLDVPYRSLEEHQERERRFLAAAWRDPVLSAQAFVFVFGLMEGARR